LVRPPGPGTACRTDTGIRTGTGRRGNIGPRTGTGIGRRAGSIAKAGAAQQFAPVETWWQFWGALEPRWRCIGPRAGTGIRTCTGRRAGSIPRTGIAAQKGAPVETWSKWAALDEPRRLHPGKHISDIRTRRRAQRLRLGFGLVFHGRYLERGTAPGRSGHSQKPANYLVCLYRQQKLVSPVCPDRLCDTAGSSGKRIRRAGELGYRIRAGRQLGEVRGDGVCDLPLKNRRHRR
jgi:hypothetical protein